MPNRLIHSAAVLFLLAFAPLNSSISGDASTPAAQAKHGLSGSYYVGTVEAHSDVNPSGKDWYAQVWMDPRDFQLPRPFTGPAAVRVDPQIAFGKGEGFVPQNGKQSVWWPAGFPIPAGWVQGPDAKPWEHLAAVIWKGYIRLPKAGTYYLTTISNRASAVYLNKARVALNGSGLGVVVSDAFSYAKEDIQDFAKNLALAPSMEGWAPRPCPEACYVVPVTIDAPRDLPIEVHFSSVIHPTLNAFGHSFSATGIDLFWVTPDSPHDASGKPVAQIVPTGVLYTEPPGPIEKPTVRGANSMLSADFLYFPAERTDKDVTVTMHLRDKDGHPVAGKRVHIGSLVTYGGADAIKQPEKPTDEKGETTAKIRPGAGYKVTHDSTIFATDITDMVDVAQVARVTFQAGTVPTSFFADAFSPYYDPDVIKVEPLPLTVGRPVTVSVALENRGKFPVELTATFKANDWAIGSEFKNEIGRVERIQLKPGEARRVSVTWTPGKAQGHQCFEVVLTGRVLFDSQAGGTVLVASALPAAIWAEQVAAPQKTAGAVERLKGIFERLQRNLGPVKPPPPCIEGTYSPEPIVKGGKVRDPLMYFAECTPSQKWKDYGKKLQDEYQKIYADDCGANDRIRQELKANWELYNTVGILEAIDWILRGCYHDLTMRDNARILWHDPPNSAFQRLAAAQSDTAAGYLDAWTKSWERYQAAQGEGDRQWMAKHSTAIQLYIKRFGAALRREAGAMQQEADKMSADLLAKQQRLREWLQQGAPLTSNQIKQLQVAGLSEEQIKEAITRLQADKDNVELSRIRALAIDTAALDRQSADELDRLDVNSSASEISGIPGGPLVQTYLVGNPHDKEENVDLFIRPISIPPDWKLSIVNAEKAEASAQAKLGDAPSKFPVVEREAGKHYAVTLPPKTEIKVGSVLVPKSELGANTTARWAVEGKIGNELIGGMVHEMNVPYIVADLKLPPVGSKEEEEESPRLPRKGLSSAVLIAIAAGLVLIIAIVVFVILKRRRRPGAPTGQ